MAARGSGDTRGSPSYKRVKYDTGPLPSLSASQVIVMMQAEVAEVCSIGLEKCLATCGNKLGKSMDGLMPALSMISSLQYQALDNEDTMLEMNFDRHVEAHADVFDPQYKYGDSWNKSERTRTIPVVCSALQCLRVWVDLVQGLKIDAKSQVSLKGPEHAKQFDGGWREIFSNVNTGLTTADWIQQKQCVFAFDGAESGDRSLEMLMKSFTSVVPLLDEAFKLVTLYARYPVVLMNVSFLFGWNTHSHLTFHNDLEDREFGGLTLNLMLSPGKSSMCVAGANEAEFDRPGAAQLFDSGLFHRSGLMQVRTVIEVIMGTENP